LKDYSEVFSAPMAIAGSEEKEHEIDVWHLICIVGNVRYRNCLCCCLNDLDLVVHDPTKINFWMSPKKLLIR